MWGKLYKQDYIEYSTNIVWGKLYKQGYKPLQLQYLARPQLIDYRVLRVAFPLFIDPGIQMIIPITNEQDTRRNTPNYLNSKL